MMTINPKNNKTGLALRALALGAFTAIISLSGIKAVAQTETKEKIVFAELDQLPRFTTCEVQDDKDEQFACFTQTLLTHISKNMVLNETLRSNKVAGRVFVKITFSEDGRAKDITIMRGFNNDKEELEEAIQQQYDNIKEILLQLPRFEPGIKNGEKVSVEFTIPINFRLQEELEE